MVAKPRKEDDPRYMAMMGAMRLEHKKDLAKAAQWVRESPIDTIAWVRKALDDTMDEALKEGDTGREIITRLAQLGFEYAHLAMYEEDKSGNT